MYFAFCFIFVGCSNNTEENNTKENNAEEKYCSWCDNDPSTLSRFSRIEISTSATCSQGGVAIVKCKCCKRTAEISVPALGHDYKMIKDEATCLQSGNIYYACQRHGCSSQKTEFSIANPLNHRWILTESHETISYNQKKYECAICGKTKTEKTEVDMGKKLKNTQEEFYYATGAAIRIVKQKLKYPSSANFLKENLMEVHYILLCLNCHYSEISPFPTRPSVIYVDCAYLGNPMLPYFPDGGIVYWELPDAPEWYPYPSYVSVSTVNFSTGAKFTWTAGVSGARGEFSLASYFFNTDLPTGVYGVYIYMHSDVPAWSDIQTNTVTFRYVSD